MPEVLPLLYLHGLSSSDSRSRARAVPWHRPRPVPATITRLAKDWQDESTAFNKCSLAGTDYVYVWGDGIHLKVRLEQDKVCLLVMIGVRADGTKELIALDDGHRESTESWADLLRSCKRRGIAAPVLAVGTARLGFWAARSGRCSRDQGRVTKCAGSGAAGIVMAFKHIEATRHRWRAVTLPTSSHWSAQAPASRRAKSSNAPTRSARRQEAIGSFHNTPIHRS